jgi:hypothetical protein
VGVEFAKTSMGENLETRGTMTLYVDERPCASADMRTPERALRPLRRGPLRRYDSGDPVSRECTPKFPFAGGRLIEVVYDVGKDAHLDVERRFAAALARNCAPG